MNHMQHFTIITKQGHIYQIEADHPGIPSATTLNNFAWIVPIARERATR